MGADNQDKAAVESRLWHEIEKNGTQMLGVVGGEPRHFQPMTAFVERETSQLWFFTYKDADIAETVASGEAQAMFVIQGKELRGCIGGRLQLSHDPARIDRYWSPTVAAWYPGGKDDPRLTLLRFDAEDAHVWIDAAGPLRFAWEVAKANANHERPDVGGRTSLDLH